MTDTSQTTRRYRRQRGLLVLAIAVAVLGMTSAQALTAGPMASVNPTELNFSDEVGGGVSAKAVTLSNDGDAQLTGIGVSVDSPDPPAGKNAIFRVDNNGCGATLDPGMECSVIVTFEAATVGDVTGKLKFTTDANSPSVNLKGTGTQPTTTPPPPPPPATLPPPPPSPPGSDLDKDGVPDSTDACPLVEGVAPSGCPRNGSAGDDQDDDGVADSADKCPAVAGNLATGCPGKLNADIHGHWRVNDLFSQLVTLTVNTTIGSRIELRCTHKCGFTKRTVRSTTSRLTNLTRYFRGKRILPAGVSITVRVTRAQQVGTYERLQTRSGRKLPRVTKRCLSARSGAVGICSS